MLDRTPFGQLLALLAQFLAGVAGQALCHKGCAIRTQGRGVTFARAALMRQQGERVGGAVPCFRLIGQQEGVGLQAGLQGEGAQEGCDVGAIEMNARPRQRDIRIRIPTSQKIDQPDGTLLHNPEGQQQHGRPARRMRHDDHRRYAIGAADSLDPGF